MTHETEDEKKRREEEEFKQATKEIVDYLQHISTPISATDLFKWCDKSPSKVFAGFHSHTVKKSDGTNYPKKPCYLAYEVIKDCPRENGVAYHVKKAGNGRELKLYGGAIDEQTDGVTVNPAAATPTGNFTPQAAQAVPDGEQDLNELIAECEAEDSQTDAPDADGNE